MGSARAVAAGWIGGAKYSSRAAAAEPVHEWRAALLAAPGVDLRHFRATAPKPGAGLGSRAARRAQARQRARAAAGPAARAGSGGGAATAGDRAPSAGRAGCARA